jgi:hypothetical protein
MTIILRPEQENQVREAIHAGLIHSPEEVVDRGLEVLRHGLEGAAPSSRISEVVDRLSSFGQRHNLSLQGTTLKELIDEARP